MKLGGLLRGGVLGGACAALVLTAAGRLLEWTVWPWATAVPAPALLERVIDWLRTAVILAPLCAVPGIVAAFGCALVFEYVTERAGWINGTVVGLLLGTVAAFGAALVPWVAFRFGYVYWPVEAPFGRSDPAWALVVLFVAGVVAGLVAGGSYGKPRHHSRAAAPIRWREVFRAAP